MISLSGEITEINNPPNRADQFREVTIWINETEEHLDLTVGLPELQNSGMAVGDKITIKVDKAFDIDSLTQDLFNMK